MHQKSHAISTSGRESSRKKRSASGRTFSFDTNLQETTARLAETAVCDPDQLLSQSTKIHTSAAKGQKRWSSSKYKSQHARTRRSGLVGRSQWQVQWRRLYSTSSSSSCSCMMRTATHIYSLVCRHRGMSCMDPKHKVHTHTQHCQNQPNVGKTLLPLWPAVLSYSVFGYQAPKLTSHTRSVAHSLVANTAVHIHHHGERKMLAENVVCKQQTNNEGCFRRRQLLEIDGFIGHTRTSGDIVCGDTVLLGTFLDTRIRLVRSQYRTQIIRVVPADWCAEVLGFGRYYTTLVVIMLSFLFHPSAARST